MSNHYVVWALVVGMALLCAVLFIPALYPFLLVEPLTTSQLLWILGLAFEPTLVIQTVKMIREIA